MKIFIIIIIYVFTSITLRSQPDSTLNQDDVIKTVVKIRDQLIKQSDSLFAQFVSLEHKIWESDLDEDKKRRFISFIQSTINIENPSNYFYQVKDLIKEKKYRKTFASEFKSIEMDWALTKSIVKDMSSLGIINKTYPYRVSISDTLISEIDFYQIQHGKTIGEVGAGKGRFGVLLALSLDASDVFLNDISNRVIKHMEFTINLLDSIDYSSQLYVVKGSKSNTKLPKNHFDFIILRNSFHHFKKKDNMVKAIRKNLKDGGILYLREPIKTSNPKPAFQVCPLELRKDEIISILSKHGFQLTNELPNGPFLLMKFVIKGSEQ